MKIVILDNVTSKAQAEQIKDFIQQLFTGNSYRDDQIKIFSEMVDLIIIKEEEGVYPQGNHFYIGTYSDKNMKRKYKNW